jgi:hypothetical protein
MVQILQHAPSLHSLCLVYNEGHGDSLLEWLSPRILDNGQVDCFILKLNTISIQLGSQLVTPVYGVARALKGMIVSRCSLAHNTHTGNNISGPIERIQKVEMECFYDGPFDGDGTRWREEVSEILAPLQEVVDMLQVVIY